MVALSFDPQAGYEQRGRRLALVVSNDLFNQRTGLAVVCPVTSTKRDFPFHVPLPAGLSVTGFVMVERVRAIDFAPRRVRFIQKAPTPLLNEVLSILDACLY